MMDIQESEEDMEKVECEWGSLPMTPSPAPSFMSIKSGQSMDRPIAFNRGAQSNIGEKVRLDETPSPALSHLSMTSDQSMDRPIAFNNGKQNYMDERVRSNETPSLVPLHLSMTSHQTMDCPIAFNNEKQRYMGENVRLAEAPSPAPSHLSVKSYQSMDRPIAFRNGTLDYGLRPNEAPSPSASYFSLKSNQSMDRPIAFKDNTHPYNAKRLRQEETPSPAPSFQSMKSHQSMDRPIAFNSGTSSYTGLRPDEAPSPATSYLSLQSNQSMDRPIAFKDRTQTYGAKKVLHVAPSPAPSLMSVKSDQSMDRPIAFSSRARNYMTENLNEPYEATSPAPSLTSLKSEQSMDRPITFRNEAHSHEFRSTLSAVLLTDDHYRCSVCTEVFKDPVSIPCGHSYCKHCIEIYWSKPAQPQGYACPQCRKRFRDRPVLNVNLSLTKVIEELLKAGFSPAIPVQCYAGPEDVPCDICTEMKLKAVKSCLTCTASFCETHIRQHYTVPALHRHNLVEAIIFPNKEEEKSQDEIRDLVTRVTELEATSKRLCKRFEIHCNGFSDFPPDVIEMAALGRPLKLGMLYDNKTNSFCQDTFKWDEDMLACLKVSLPRPQTHVKVLENDSPHERFRVLEMSPVLQVGTQTGQIKINGSASFLNHPEQSQYQERATLHYRTTTRLDMISQRHLQESAPSAVFGQTTASHVIIAVYYGAQAFFVFDSSGSNHDKNTEIADVLKTLTSTFCSNHIISSLNAAEKAKSSSFSCSLYIDVGDWKSPVSFDKAVDIYGSLPMLLGSKGEKAIPLKVWLYPLEKLVKSPVHAALSEVSENLKHQVENVLEHLRKQIMICQDMITDFANVKVIQWFPTLEDKLLQFTELLQEYQTTFQKRITETVHIKEGKTERSSQELLERYQQSPFSAEKTNQWLENKETELRILNDCRAADITVVKSQAELQQIISDPQITRVMCLTLFSPNSEDSFLTALKNYSKFDQILRNDSLMFRPINIDQKALIKVQLFIAANEDEEQTKFIATSITGDDFPEYSVQFYHYGRIESRNVTFGTKPDFAQPILVKHTSLSLKLKQPHKNSIESYMVEHRDLADDGRNSTWKRIKFDATGFRETCLISDLNPGHQYQLRYIFVEQDCMTFSRITNFQTAVAETPGQPFVDRLSRDSLRVMWQKAEADCPVLHYLVEYKEAGLEGWSSVLTQGPECEYILTLPHSTCYRIRVSAVYEEITSKPSEETSVPVNVWYINLSERKSYILLEVLKLQTEKKPVELIDWTDEESEVRGFLQCLPYISQLRFGLQQNGLVKPWEKRKRLFIMNLCLQAALDPKKTVNTVLLKLSSVSYERSDFLLDLYSHLKNYESQSGRIVLPALQSLYQSAPAVWRIKLSERKSSILLEVLKLQTEKKPVELIDWTDEESELRGFLQCLPDISQLRFAEPQNNTAESWDKRKRSFILKLSLQAALHQKEKIEETVNKLLSSVEYKKSVFLLDLCSYVKDYESQTGWSVLPALQPVYQSPAVWRIKLSERKSSILLEVLKLQTEKKPVELIDWTDEESELRGFLQCLPYISQLRFAEPQNNTAESWDKRKRSFILKLSLQAALHQKEKIEETVNKLLSSVEYKKSVFLLDLCSYVKDYESQTGWSVLPALQPVYQSPAVWRIKLSERKSSILLEVLKLQTEKKPVELIDWTDEESELRGFLQCLPYISQLRFAEPQNNTAESWDKRKRSFILKLSLQAALHQKEKIEETVNKLLSSVEYKKSVFLLDLCSYVKDYESQTGWSVLPALQPVYQSPAVWRIKLSERKSSILLEVLKLQTEKKPVELIDWTDEESELRGFLQCLPYISQLRFVIPRNKAGKSWEKIKRLFILDMCLQAALHQEGTIEEAVKKLLSSVNYEKSPFLLDLCSHVKNYESQTGKSVLPALQPVYQSLSTVWSIKFSIKKSSILLEVLKLQTEKKPVELIDCTDEESEVRGFLQCLPYISQLRFDGIFYKNREIVVKFLWKLFVSASEYDTDTGENCTELLTSACSYTSFPCKEFFFIYRNKQSNFLLDLWSHVKNYKSQTGRSVFPALQPVYQSAPAVWRINLSERKSSILLEVLKLQTEKKPVELIDWTDEESELRGFLQCLPYISQLRVHKFGFKGGMTKRAQFLLNLTVEASKCVTTTGENYIELLTSVCSYRSFLCLDEDDSDPEFQTDYCDFLLDQWSHVKDYESQTGRSVLPALKPVYQSAPAVWRINLSERKSSILLEVLKLQTEKKPVELIDWTDEESEVKIFLQCLPYISQLSFQSLIDDKKRRSFKFLVNLIVLASYFTTKENYKEIFTSVCSYRSFPFTENYINHYAEQSNFLLDLYSHVKDLESQTGRSVLLALQPVYQVAPAVWRIKLLERKSSILLEVLKLQTEKKPVELIDLTDEESELRRFLQCLPYISELRIPEFGFYIEMKKRAQFLLNLTVEASKCVTTTGESYIVLLTSVCSYRSFVCFDDDDYYQDFQSKHCDFLLDLCSRVKDYESQSGRSVLPALQPVYQSAPGVWRIKLSERKSSILLEVLKLQTEKKPVELIDWTDEESEVRGFLQCLSYISQLRIHEIDLDIEMEERAQFLLNLTVEASKCVTTTGESYIELLTSVCSYRSFVCLGNDDYYEEFQSEHCDFLLDLCSRVKDYESQSGRKVLPALQPVYQSAPGVWRIKLSERKSSILLEVLKLQTEKKPVELIDWTDEESEVRGFIQCLPYISQLRFSNASVKFLLSLIVSALELDANTQENYTGLLTSACCYTSFPYDETDDDDVQFYQCDFLLDLYSRVKDYESQTGRSVLPALQPVYQSAPAVWIIDLSERTISILLEVLKLQIEKKPVELLDWTDEESGLRRFLQCLPYISELRNADQHFPSLCKMFGPRVKADKVTPLLQALNFTVTLSGKLPSSTCISVGRVLSLSQSKVNLTLKPRAISLRGLKLLFRPITHLQTLSLECKILVKMVRALRSLNDPLQLTTEELSLITNGSKQNPSHIQSSLTSLLKLMSVQCLDLTQCKAEALSITALLGLQDPLILRFSKEALQQLVSVVYEAQDNELTRSFIKKTSKDLTSCSLTWEKIHYLLQHEALNLKVDFRNSKINLENVKELLPVLNKVQLKRLSPGFTLSIITEIYETRSPQYVSSLLSSAGNCFNLNGRVLDSVHCAALRFTLEHCNTVKLNLLWTSIPEEELKSFLPLFNRVTQLSVDRLLLLKLLRCCSSSDVQREAAAALLSALHHRLDISCSSALDLTDTLENQEHFNLSIEDSTIISSVLQKTQSVVKLILKDCELSDEALKHLWPILPKVQLSCSKALLLQFLAYISEGGAESGTVRSAEALSQALGREMDLSHTQLDQRSCTQLAVFLEYSEGLTELDLSHCKLTDQCMEPLLLHLHKTQTLDLSHNNITDKSANTIHSIVSNHSNMQTVRLFGNRITDRKQFIKDKRFEIW
ncbi:uncharacterized protein si:ch211-281l24.3 isoform X2 [Danio aesculapii]|uniref:uncharacterized protein si:ch211-281l24.3 isoform X2 n=1 Tax=Danio aesculapii TaxID=1142201 RepID=UPI0024C0BF69|nr:uncharacterized protein si:ch211-281l24.3 isoform X2 [Danio aesculapii]